MKNTLLSALVIWLLTSCGGISFETKYTRWDLAPTGELTAVIDKASEKNYLPQHDTLPTPFLQIEVNREYFPPKKASWNAEQKTLTLTFPQKITVHLRVEQKEEYLRLEVIDVENNKAISSLFWGPYHFSIGEQIGETVGVIRGEGYAFGFQSLNSKTLSGTPDNLSDVMPSYDIFADDPTFVDVKTKKELFRGNAAKATAYGSYIQAYVRNRHKDRIVPNWKREHYLSPALDDSGIIGSAIVLFGCPAIKALPLIGRMEVAEGLPHPLLNGEWAKTSEEATASYIITGFGINNTKETNKYSVFDELLDMTTKAGLHYLYHSGPFANWGHFDLNPKAFPGNWKTLRTLSDRAAERGVYIGVHTLSNFITTNDPYVTPTPSKHLGRVGSSKLSHGISKTSQEIPINDPIFFKGSSTLRTVRINKELIQYQSVSDEKPWRLMKCTRGAWGTQTANHPSGAEVVMLADHDYRTFLTDRVLQDSMALTLAHLFNEANLHQISFDGLEGTHSSGLGEYAKADFVKLWYDNLKPEIQKHVINDASNTTHFHWHIYTRMNWGEPWYAGFRESQTAYRLKNQRYYERNLMPKMLGWFKLGNSTSLEDMEWLLARAAGFHSGFGLSTSVQTYREHGKIEALLHLINIWETARHKRVFPEKTLTDLQDITKEFHLEEITPNKKWKLYPIAVKNKLIHKKRDRQPGEPTFSMWSFDNPHKEQPVTLLAIVQGGKNAAISRLMVTINSNKTELPILLKKGEFLRWEGNKITVYTNHWHEARSYTVPSTVWIKGKNSISFDCHFADDATNIKVEFRSTGEGSPLSAKQSENKKQV